MEPPSFTTSGPQVVRVAPGSDTSFILPLPTGTPPFQYEWRRAGATLDDRFTRSDDSRGVSLTISAATTDDSGVYTLQASNAAGKATTRVRLEVSPDEMPIGDDPPTFLRRLQDLTVKVGTRTRFLVEIVSSTECRVTWYRNERRLLEAERIALVRDGSFWCADIATVSVDDAGRWTCTAENAGGRASCSAHLNVLVPKAYKRPEFVEELRAILTEQGTVSLECKVVGVPTPVLRWFKDSCEIKAGDVFALTANAEDPTSLGTYTCEAVNCMGRAYSSSKVHVVGRASREGSARPSSGGITPEPPPIFTKELEDQFVRICERLTLSCHIVVPPWPRSVVWYNKEGKVEASEKYHVLEDGVGGYMLEIPVAEWPDEGEWKCVATSAGGRVGISTCLVSMDVPKNYRKPRFMENLQAVLTEEGLVSFECKVVGFPTPVLSWFKDGQELKPGDVYQLTGTNSLGSYCCIAKNCMGQASSSAELTVEDIQNQLNDEEKLQLFSRNQAPKFLQGLKSVEAKIDEPFRFTIKVSIPPEPSVLWYRDDQPVDESSRCHHGKEDRGVFFLDIQSLEFMDQAEWKCVSMNDFGHSVTSCFLKLIIPRHYKKPRFLENLQAILSDEGAVNLECKVIGVPQPVLKWYKDGEELKPGDIHRIISGQDGTCCLGTYTCEARNCMGIAASSASLLGYEDSLKTASKKKGDEQSLQRNLSLSTIHEERTSQMYDTPVGDITLDDKGELSFSFDGREVSVSLYETPDLTEEEALQIVEMYADQLSENVTEHNVVELPPLRFVKETSTSGNLLMEAIIIDVSPEYFASTEEDLRTEADIDDISIAEENVQPQLSLDQEFGEDYLEKTMALLSDEKSDLPKRPLRRKSDSQKSGEDFYSLSKDETYTEGKKEDDTQQLSESELQSFESAHSLEKRKSKSPKPHGEESQELSDLTKNVLLKEEVQKPQISKIKKRRLSRRSSSGSEKSVDINEEEFIENKDVEPKENVTENLKNRDMLLNLNINVGTAVAKITKELQLIEEEVTVQSHTMSAIAAASQSLKLIKSLQIPLSQIDSVNSELNELVRGSINFNDTVEIKLSNALKSLHQSVTILGKCIEVESDSKTLAQKTCIMFIERCGEDMQNLLKSLESLTLCENILFSDTCISNIKSYSSATLETIGLSTEAIKNKNNEKESKEEKIIDNVETAHLKITQKTIQELRMPLNLLLCVVDNSISSDGNAFAAGKSYSEVILSEMSTSIQDLQVALEQIETLSVKEAASSLPKYNTEIIETVMNSVLKLRTSFEELSSEIGSSESLTPVLITIKSNIIELSSQLDDISGKIGAFDVLQNENKLEVLQKMAQVLISLENSASCLEDVPEVKLQLNSFHTNLTKLLENVIESNESEKYLSMMEICSAVNKINDLLKTNDLENELPLIGINNLLRVIQANLRNVVFSSEINNNLSNSITDLVITLQKSIHQALELTSKVLSEQIEDISVKIYDKEKAVIITEQIERTLVAINSVSALETITDIPVKQTLEKISPILVELQQNIAAFTPHEVHENETSSLPDLNFEKSFAKPLYDLHENITVLNNILHEHIEAKVDSEIIKVCAEPLLELYNTLEILQQDVVSQYGEDLSIHDINSSLANAVQSLQSCILLVQEPAAVEVADDMSTLDDISVMKTIAEPLPVDQLILPLIGETSAEQSITPLKGETQSPVLAQTMFTLNEHINILQSPEIIEALNTLSTNDKYSSLELVVPQLIELNRCIEGMAPPISIEPCEGMGSSMPATQVSSLVEPLRELHESLSVIDFTTLPLCEDVAQLPEQTIKTLQTNLLELKEDSNKYLNAIVTAINIADSTIDVSKLIQGLRNYCERFKSILKESSSFVDCEWVKAELMILDYIVDDFLQTTDTMTDTDMVQVKDLIKNIYKSAYLVENEFIRLAVPPETLRYEIELIKTLEDIEKNVEMLEKCDFLELSELKIPSFTSEHFDKNCFIHADKIIQIVEETLRHSALEDSESLKKLLYTCKNRILLLRSLLNKCHSPEKNIRLLHEYCNIRNTMKSLKNEIEKFNLTGDLNQEVITISHEIDSFTNDVGNSLLKILKLLSESLYLTPLNKINQCIVICEEMIQLDLFVDMQDFIQNLKNVISVIYPCIRNIKFDNVEDLEQCEDFCSDVEYTIERQFNSLLSFVDENLAVTDNKLLLEDISTVVKKHLDFKNSSGIVKKLIVLNCLYKCSEILRQKLYEKRTIENVLTETKIALQALHHELNNVSKENESADFILEDHDLFPMQSFIQMLKSISTEIKDYVNLDDTVMENKNISEVKTILEEIESIKNDTQALKITKMSEIVNNVYNTINTIEQPLHILLCLTKECNNNEDNFSKEKSPSLLLNMKQCIQVLESKEWMSAIEMEEIQETAAIVKQLLQSFVASLLDIDNLTKENMTEQQVNLAQKLQDTIFLLQAQISKKLEAAVHEEYMFNQISKNIFKVQRHLLQLGITNVEQIGETKSGDVIEYSDGKQLAEEADDEKQLEEKQELLDANQIPTHNNQIQIDNSIDNFEAFVKTHRDSKNAEDAKDDILHQAFSSKIKIEENSLLRLNTLLQQVNEEINMASKSDFQERSDVLQNTLDEIQTVIIKLKQDYDGCVNETLHEALEDLECSVRSVQLQINEESPPELLIEACATVQLIVTGIHEITKSSTAVQGKINIDTIINSCANDASQIVELLNETIDVDSQKVDMVLYSLSNVKETMKKIKTFFSDSESLIENGIEVIQGLDQVEDILFSLEKDIMVENLLEPVSRDSILSIIHSSYSCLSNMRGTLASVQKRYMYENYGKPFDQYLRSIKIFGTLYENDKKPVWKNLAKLLRRVLNHFEDIKFYINLDKTARLPNDCGFTKIILKEIKDVLSELILNELQSNEIDCLKQILSYMQSIQLELEPKVTLEVKEKIPIFKELSKKILDVAENFLRQFLKTDEFISIIETHDNLGLDKSTYCIEEDHFVEKSTDSMIDKAINSKKTEELETSINKEDNAEIASVQIKDKDVPRVETQEANVARVGLTDTQNEHQTGTSNKLNTETVTFVEPSSSDDVTEIKLASEAKGNEEILIYNENLDIIQQLSIQEVKVRDEKSSIPVDDTIHLSEDSHSLQSEHILSKQPGNEIDDNLPKFEIHTGDDLTLQTNESNLEVEEIELREETEKILDIIDFMTESNNETEAETSDALCDNGKQTIDKEQIFSKHIDDISYAEKSDEKIISSEKDIEFETSEQLRTPTEGMITGESSGQIIVSKSVDVIEPIAQTDDVTIMGSLIKDNNKAQFEKVSISTVGQQQDEKSNKYQEDKKKILSTIEITNNDEILMTQEDTNIKLQEPISEENVEPEIKKILKQNITDDVQRETQLSDDSETDVVPTETKLEEKKVVDTDTKIQQQVYDDTILLLEKVQDTSEVMQAEIQVDDIEINSEGKSQELLKFEETPSQEYIKGENKKTVDVVETQTLLVDETEVAIDIKTEEEILIKENVHEIVQEKVDDDKNYIDTDPKLKKLVKICEENAAREEEVQKTISKQTEFQLEEEKIVDIEISEQLKVYEEANGEDDQKPYDITQIQCDTDTKNQDSITNKKEVDKHIYNMPQLDIPSTEETEVVTDRKIQESSGKFDGTVTKEDIKEDFQGKGDVMQNEIQFDSMKDEDTAKKIPKSIMVCEETITSDYLQEVKKTKDVMQTETQLEIEKRVDIETKPQDQVIICQEIISQELLKEGVQEMIDELHLESQPKNENEVDTQTKTQEPTIVYEKEVQKIFDVVQEGMTEVTTDTKTQVSEMEIKDIFPKEISKEVYDTFDIVHTESKQVIDEKQKSKTDFDKEKENQEPIHMVQKDTGKFGDSKKVCTDVKTQEPLTVHEKEVKNVINEVQTETLLKNESEIASDIKAQGSVMEFEKAFTNEVTKDVLETIDVFQTETLFEDVLEVATDNKTYDNTTKSEKNITKKDTNDGQESLDMTQSQTQIQDDDIDTKTQPIVVHKKEINEMQAETTLQDVIDVATDIKAQGTTVKCEEGFMKDVYEIIQKPFDVMQAETQVEDKIEIDGDTVTQRPIIAQGNEYEQVQKEIVLKEETDIVTDIKTKVTELVCDEDSMKEISEGVRVTTAVLQTEIKLKDEKEVNTDLKGHESLHVHAKEVHKLINEAQTETVLQDITNVATDIKVQGNAVEFGQALMKEVSKDIQETIDVMQTETQFDDKTEVHKLINEAKTETISQDIINAATDIKTQGTTMEFSDALIKEVSKVHVKEVHKLINEAQTETVLQDIIDVATDIKFQGNTVEFGEALMKEVSKDIQETIDVMQTETQFDDKIEVHKLINEAKTETITQDIDAATDFKTQDTTMEFSDTLIKEVSKDVQETIDVMQTETQFDDKQEVHKLINEAQTESLLQDVIDVETNIKVQGTTTEFGETLMKEVSKDIQETIDVMQTVTQLDDKKEVHQLINEVATEIVLQDITDVATDIKAQGSTMELSDALIKEVSKDIQETIEVMQTETQFDDKKEVHKLINEAQTETLLQAITDVATDINVQSTTVKFEEAIVTEVSKNVQEIIDVMQTETNLGDKGDVDNDTISQDLIIAHEKEIQMIDNDVQQEITLKDGTNIVTDIETQETESVNDEGLVKEVLKNVQETTDVMHTEIQLKDDKEDNIDLKTQERLAIHEKVVNEVLTGTLLQDVTDVVTDVKSQGTTMKFEKALVKEVSKDIQKTIMVMETETQLENKKDIDNTTTQGSIIANKKEIQNVIFELENETDIKTPGTELAFNEDIIKEVSEEVQESTGVLQTEIKLRDEEEVKTDVKTHEPLHVHAKEVYNLINEVQTETVLQDITDVATDIKVQSNTVEFGEALKKEVSKDIQETIDVMQTETQIEDKIEVHKLINEAQTAVLEDIIDVASDIKVQGTVVESGDALIKEASKDIQKTIDVMQTETQFDNKKEADNDLKTQEVLHVHAKEIHKLINEAQTDTLQVPTKVMQTDIQFDDKEEVGTVTKTQELIEVLEKIATKEDFIQSCDLIETAPQLGYKDLVESVTKTEKPVMSQGKIATNESLKDDIQETIGVMQTEPYDKVVDIAKIRQEPIKEDIQKSLDMMHAETLLEKDKSESATDLKHFETNESSLSDIDKRDKIPVDTSKLVENIEKTCDIIESNKKLKKSEKTAKRSFEEDCKEHDFKQEECITTVSDIFHESTQPISSDVHSGSIENLPLDKRKSSVERENVVKTTQVEQYDDAIALRADNKSDNLMSILREEIKTDIEEEEQLLINLASETTTKEDTDVSKDLESKPIFNKAILKQPINKELQKEENVQISSNKKQELKTVIAEDDLNLISAQSQPKLQLKYESLKAEESFEKFNQERCNEILKLPELTEQKHANQEVHIDEFLLANVVSKDLQIMIRENQNTEINIEDQNSKLAPIHKIISDESNDKNENQPSIELQSEDKSKSQLHVDSDFRHKTVLLQDEKQDRDGVKKESEKYDGVPMYKQVGSESPLVKARSIEKEFSDEEKQANLKEERTKENAIIGEHDKEKTEIVHRSSSIIDEKGVKDIIERQQKESDKSVLMDEYIVEISNHEEQMVTKTRSEHDLEVKNTINTEIKSDKLQQMQMLDDTSKENSMVVTKPGKIKSKSESMKDKKKKQSDVKKDVENQEIVSKEKGSAIGRKKEIISTIDITINKTEPELLLKRDEKILTKGETLNNIEVSSKERNHIKAQDIHEKISTVKTNSSINNRNSNYNHGLVQDSISNGLQDVKKINSIEKPIFIDHNKSDFSLDFSKPPGYIPKSNQELNASSNFYIDTFSSIQKPTFYKAQSLLQESQLRSFGVLAQAIERPSQERYRSMTKSISDSVAATERRTGASRDLRKKPLFSTYLTDRTAVEGSRVKLTCSVLSCSEPVITWYKNGVLLDDKQKYRMKYADGLITMEVLNAVPSDSAEYKCTVENEHGSITSFANLKVYPSFEASPIPPTFTRSIKDSYHLAENELILECRIRGQPLPTITWLKDQMLISSNERYHACYLADGVCRLVITSPTPADSGTYTCKAENTMWSDQISHIVQFTGKESRPDINIVTLEKSRANRQVQELRRPHFTNVLSDYKILSGGTIGLQVEIKGSPTRVEWLREGISVVDQYKNAQTFVDHGTYTLALSNVTIKESGLYTCRAWSNYGNVDMNASITVLQPSEIEGKPAIIVGRPVKDVVISVGEDLNISFRVQGEPRPKVIFMKGIQDITNSQRVCKMVSDDYVKFTLKRSGVSDAGTYCILARNAYGCDRAFITVVVRQRASSSSLISDWTYPRDDTAISVTDRKYKSLPDRIPGEPSVVDGGNNWISLAWPKSDLDARAPILAYKIESWLLGKEGGARWVELGITPRNSYDAFNLKQGEEYYFRVTPRNRYGWGEPVQTSNPIGIGLAGDRPEFIDVLPGQLKILVGETAALSCSFKGKPTPEIVWMKNGYEIEEESNRIKILLGNQESSLNIKDVKIEDEGRYSCEATNVHGRASTYARMTVITDRLIWEADAKLKRERSAGVERDYPPQFTMRLRDRRVQASYPVRLTCQIIGNPAPVVTWYKDGEEVINDSRHTKSQDEYFHTLEIAPTTLDDGGVYEAMARNGCGAISCRCSLVVDKGIRAYVAPEFCCGLEPLYRLNEGEELRIAAIVEAYPSVGVTWYRDGVRLRPSRRAIMTLDHDGQIELALASVTSRDAGVYSCTASNEVGRATTSGKVEVVEGAEPSEKIVMPPVVISPDIPYSKEPIFIRKPRSSEAHEGDTVIIECEVIGDPKPDVYWLRDFLKPDYYRDAIHFKRIDAGPEYRLEIPHAKLDYTGAYSVVARNNHGEAKAIISLQILAKDPNSSDDAHNVRYGRVDVLPRFEKELTDLLCYDGDAVEFECRVSGNPEPDIRWFHYNEVVPECPDFETSYETGAARLKIKQVTAEDEGTYICQASNSLGKAKSSACLVVYPPGEPNTLSQRLRRPPALLSAASTPRSTPRSTPARSASRTPGPDVRRLCSPSRDIAPKFYTYPFNKVVEEGDNVVFKCAVKGLPSPWTTWDKDGIIITPSARITIKEKDEIHRILEIDEVTVEDVGLYRITLENDYGRAEASARLEVISHKGKFHGSLRSYSASPRKSLPYRRRTPSLSRYE